VLKVSVRKEFNGISFLFEEADLIKKGRVYDRIFWEAIEISEMEEGIPFLKRGAKPSFGKASLDGHLPSFKSSLGPSSGPGFLTFGAFTGGLAMTRTHSSSHSFSLFS
jgi:hypothetical protein